jgi:hypothetical protein
MKLSNLQMTKLAEKLLATWKAQDLVQFKVDEKKVLARLIEELKSNQNEEVAIEQEAESMLRKLELSNPGEFSRHKMFPMLKQKIAKERKFVL